jgi:hypothetical protein
MIVEIYKNGADSRRISGLLSGAPGGSGAMTESARGEPIVEDGLEGHLCSRLTLRRSDLFRRQRDLPMQPASSTAS